MNDRQWQEAWEIFRTARDLSDDERRSYLASLHTHPDIFEEVVSMLDEPAEQIPTPPPSKSGTRLGRYEIAGLLGSGGMGEVYAAHDLELGRMVAVKFLAPEVAASQRAVERLIREAKAASALNHPHIVTVYEVIRAGDDVGIAMELVEGRDLRNFCAKPLEISQLIEWGRQIAQALAAAHRRNVIHRDIKPENLMVREDGILKVLDFGLARQTDFEDRGRSTESSAMSAGTLNYMAPEQARGEAATSASDVFSLGIVLFELATGTHPFGADSPIDTAGAIAHSEPKRPSVLNPGVPAALDALLLAMLDKNPRKRPTAMEVDRQLSGLSLSTTAKPSRPVFRAAIVLAAGLAAASILLFRERILPTNEPTLSQLTTQVRENRVTAAAISPDGKNLAFAAFDGSIYLRRMNDGIILPLDTPAGLHDVDRIAWFPDGLKLLVSGSLDADGAMGHDQPGIWVMATGGGESERIFSDGKNAVPSPDGTRIALTSTDGSIIWVAGAKGSAPRRIRSGGQTGSYSSLLWSPDGKRLAYQRLEYRPAVDRRAGAKWAQVERSYQYSYESIDVETGRAAASAKNFRMNSACGLADGRVLFLRQSSTDAVRSLQLWELRTDLSTGRLLGPPRQFTHYKDITLSGISASSDGKQVVTVRELIGSPNVYVADLPPAGKDPKLLNIRRLTFSDAEEFPHSWTADGASIIFESNRNGLLNYNLYRQSIDRRESEPLVVSPFVKVMAHLSPNGQWLLYRETRDHVTWKVMRVPAQGGTPEPVLTDLNISGEFRCALQAGAQCVLRTVENDQFVFHTLDPRLGKGRELARTSWSPTVVGDWDLSPDGFEAAIPNHDSRDGKIRLIALDLDGTGIEERTVLVSGLKNLNGIVWAADSRGWYVSTQTTAGGLLAYVDVEGRVFNLLETPLPTYAVPSPDGRRIAFPMWSVSSNAWLFRGVE
jgi:eukaryotic-like serine/threonine-protein kinase